MEWSFERWPEVVLFLVALVGGMAISAWVAARDPFDDLIASLPLPEKQMPRAAVNATFWGTVYFFLWLLAGESWRVALTVGAIGGCVTAGGLAFSRQQRAKRGRGEGDG